MLESEKVTEQEETRYLLEKILKEKEKLWALHSKDKWVQVEEANTTYFHIYDCELLSND